MRNPLFSSQVGVMGKDGKIGIQVISDQGAKRRTMVTADLIGVSFQGQVGKHFWLLMFALLPPILYRALG